MNKIILSICFLFISFGVLSAQSAGAIAFIGVLADGTDDFTFVVIDDLTAGTEITFTDSGVLSSGSFRGNEGAYKYTVPAGGVTSGTVISLLGNSSDFVVANDSNVGNNGVTISTSGDQMIAFTGSSATPNFIAAVQTNSNVWQTNATNSNTSALPPGLNSNTAVAVGAGAGAGSEFDNSQYTGPRGGFSDRATALSTINNNANWTGNNSAITLDNSSFAPLLPVELSYFKGQKDNTNYDLAWQTLSELNNSHFEIQRSTNSKSWNTIDKVTGAGTTNEVQDYTYTDKAPIAGMNYYRLKQVDYDGAYEYSPIVSVDMGKDEAVTVYPNPVLEEVVFEFETEQKEGTVLSIYNINGQLVQTNMLDEDASKITLNVNDLAEGMYIMQVVSDKIQITSHFVKH